MRVLALGEGEKHVRLLIGGGLGAYYFTGIGLADRSAAFCCLYLASAAD